MYVYKTPRKAYLYQITKKHNKEQTLGKKIPQWLERLFSVKVLNLIIRDSHELDGASRICL